MRSTLVSALILSFTAIVTAQNAVAPDQCGHAQLISPAPKGVRCNAQFVPTGTYASRALISNTTSTYQVCVDSCYNNQDCQSVVFQSFGHSADPSEGYCSLFKQGGGQNVRLKKDPSASYSNKACFTEPDCFHIQALSTKKAINKAYMNVPTSYQNDAALNKSVDTMSPSTYFYLDADGTLYNDGLGFPMQTINQTDPATGEPYAATLDFPGENAQESYPYVPATCDRNSTTGQLECDTASGSTFYINPRGYLVVDQATPEEQGSMKIALITTSI